MGTGLTIPGRIKETVASSIHDNPVVVREFRTRMRGRKAFQVMGAYVLLLAVCIFIHYLNVVDDHSFNQGGTMTLGNAKVGAWMFATLTWAQTLLLMFILPALTSSSITQELEKKTIEMLALSRLSAGKIVLGKHLSGFLYALMLLGCSVPLASMCLMFGGLSPAEVAMTYAMLVSFSFLFTAIGVYWSSLFKSSSGAGVCSYGISIGYIIFTTAFGMGIIMQSSHGPGGMPHGLTIHPLTLLNPAVATFASSLINTEVCGLKFLAAIPAIGIHLAVGTLLILIATTHVKYRKVERALPIKLIFLLIISGVVWLMIGGDTASSIVSSGWQEPVKVMATLILIVSSIAASVFASGQVNNEGGPMFLYALSGRRIFKTDIGGAISYIALFTTCVYATVGATCYWVAKATHTKVDPGFFKAYVGIGIAVVLISIAMAAAGVLGSTIIKQRNSAAAFVILFLILAFAGYGIMLVYHSNGLQSSNSPIWQLAPLWPMTPIMCSTESWGPDMPKLWWKPEESWRLTACAYAMITMVLLGLSSLARRSNTGVEEE